MPVKTSRKNMHDFGDHFIVRGGKKLHGTIETNSSKNGAVALLCASLLNHGITTFKKMPHIEEVYRIIEVLESIGVSTKWSGNTLTISRPRILSLKNIHTESAKRTRSIIMFIGALIHEMRSFSLPQSGGCKLGSRTVRPHFYALENIGVNIQTKKDAYQVSHRDLFPASFLMFEPGDTATENAILGVSRLHGTSTIKHASANYMVQELCYFLRELGVPIEGIGTSTLTIVGTPKIEKNITYTISEDPTDAMFFLASAIVTNSTITITRAPIEFLEAELLHLEKMGFRYSLSKRYKGENGVIELVDITTKPSHLVALPEKIHARPFPAINMDNLPFFAVIATQAEGTTLIHDWTYEKRALYYTELDKLGANTTLADPHRIFIRGKTPLKSAELICPPALRPATILLVAMLAAEGTSTLRNIYSIRRGYEDIAQRLASIGADIEE